MDDTDYILVKKMAMKRGFEENQTRKLNCNQKKQLSNANELQFKLQVDSSHLNLVDLDSNLCLTWTNQVWVEVLIRF